MHTKKSWFSLIELIVGISISLVLMVWVGVFITSGMKHLTNQSLMVQMQGSIDNSLENIENIFATKNTQFFTWSQTEGILLQTDTGLGEWLITFLWPKTVSWYCGEDDALVEKLVLQRFTPFEGESWDFFSGVSRQDPSALISSSGGYFSYEGKTYATDFDIPVDFASSWGKYFITDRGNHSIFAFDTFSKTLTKIYGKAIPGAQTGYLNQPSGIAFGSNTIFIADTANNRIISLSPTGENMEEVLGVSSGLNQPTGLYFTWGVLYIADTGNKRVLAYHSKNISSPTDLTFDIIPTSTFDTTQALLTVFSTTLWEIALTQTGNISWWGTGNIVWKSIEYTFPEQSFFQGVPVSVDFSGISWDLSATGSYYVRLTLDGTQQFYQTFFTKGDGNIETLWDNTLEIFATGFLFPTGIFLRGGDIEIQDFLQREKLLYDAEGNFISSGALLPLNWENIFSPKEEKISDFVIEKDSFSFQKIWNMLHIGFEYYTQYDCLDPTQNIKKNMIIKKELN